MAKILTAREVGDRLELTHLEVIRRIRRGDIEAEKLGWNWIIKESEVEKVREADWYKKVMILRAARSA